MMSQPRLHSLVEQGLNVASGFILALLIWMYVIMPVYGLQVSFSENVGITIIFTVVSVIRGYFWRRLANWYQERKVRK